MSKKMKYILMVSIAANILFAGFYIGGWIKHENRPSFVERVPEGLNQQSREIYKTEMKALREQNKEKRKETRETRKELSRIIAADVFDEKAYRNQLKKMHTGHKNMIEGYEEAMIRIISQLSLEERQILAQSFERRSKKSKD